MRVEVIVQGVVAVLRIEADFDVIALPKGKQKTSRSREHFSAQLS
jgi:hypothetical protein